MSRVIKVYDRWAGEHGRLGPYSPPPGSFSAANMMVAADGTLHVRPGLVETTPVGMVAGPVLAFESTAVPNREGFFVVGSTAYHFDMATPGGAMAAYTGLLAAVPTKPMKAAKLGTKLYITSYSDKSYVVDPTAGTVVALTGSPGGRAIEIYGERAVVGSPSDAVVGNRLRYSNAADFNAWPAANFVDIGDAWHVTDVRNFRGFLAVAKGVGWSILTGVPGVNDTVRTVTVTDGPYRPHNVARDLNTDRLWMLGFGDDCPSYFDGSGVVRHRFLGRFSGTHDTDESAGPRYGVLGVRGHRDDGVLYCGENAAALFLNGAWTYHSFGVPIGGYVVQGPSRFTTFCDGGAPGTPARTFTFNLNAGTPGIEGGSWMRAGDASAQPVVGSVTFPESFAPDGAELAVRAVTVDFASFNTGGLSNNHFDVQVRARRLYESADSILSAVQSWDGVPAASSTGGTLRRATFLVGDQGVGSAFQLLLTNVRGVAVHRIFAVCDQDPGRW